MNKEALYMIFRPSLVSPSIGLFIRHWVGPSVCLSHFFYAFCPHLTKSCTYAYGYDGDY